ncbi:MAG: DUF350 domain-containing protein [Myxococcales bacterium]|nr:DUF350 domain-containing protein [Myxococcales bacterium]
MSASELQALSMAAVAAVLFALVGAVFFAIAFVIMRALSPFSIRKEIEQDQNKALAVLIGSVLLGIALIVAAALEGEAAGAPVTTGGLGWGALLHGLVVSVLFALVGLVLFGASFFVATRVLPFSVRKEIEEDHNVALALVLGAVNVGLGLIVAAAVRG